MSIATHSPPAAAAAPQAAARNPVPGKKIPHPLFRLPPSAICDLLFFLGADSINYKKVCKQFKRMLETNMSQQIQAVAKGARPDLLSGHSKLDVAFHLSGMTLARSFMRHAAPPKMQTLTNVHNETRFALDGETLFTSELGPANCHQIVKTTPFGSSTKVIYPLERAGLAVECMVASKEILACSIPNDATQKSRVLIWDQDRPDHPVHTIRLPKGVVHRLKIHDYKLFVCMGDVWGSSDSSEILMYDIASGGPELARKRNASKFVSMETLEMAFDSACTLFTQHAYMPYGSEIGLPQAALQYWDLRTQCPITTISDSTLTTMHLTEDRLYTSHQFNHASVIQLKQEATHDVIRPAICKDPQLKQWDRGMRNPVKQTTVRGDKIIFPISGNSGYLYTSSTKGVVRLWDLNLNLQAKRDLKRFTDIPVDADFCADILGVTPNFFLLGASQDTYIYRKLFSKPSSRQLKLLSFPAAHMKVASDTSGAVDVKAKK